MFHPPARYARTTVISLVEEERFRTRGKITKACDSALRFARACRLRPGDIVQPAARVRVDHAERLFLATEMQENCNQRDMLYDIGKIPRMEDVAVIHYCSLWIKVCIACRSHCLPGRIILRHDCRGREL